MRKTVLKESKKYNKLFVKASSLLESVIAITIIATCLLIAIRVYASVLNSSSSINAYRMKFKVNELVNETKQTQEFDDEIYELKGYTIKKTVSDLEKNNKIKKVKYEVYTKSDTLIYNYMIKQHKINE